MPPLLTSTTQRKLRRGTGKTGGMSKVATSVKDEPIKASRARARKLIFFRPSSPAPLRYNLRYIKRCSSGIALQQIRAQLHVHVVPNTNRRYNSGNATQR